MNKYMGGIYINKIIFLILGVFLISCLWWFSSRTVLNMNQDSGLSSYVSDEYRISLKYNKEWEENTNYSNRYEGKDGFFQISALTGSVFDIDEVAKMEATHQLMPYGSRPQISKLMIQGQEARLIMPSKDQVKEFSNQAELIIKYPKVLEIGGETYYYFILWADKNHIQEIAKTIAFIS